jgi:hypothetical protein
MSLSAKHEWYVYALVDPRDHGIFYIGKGKCRRAFQHELDAKRGKVRNQQKHDRIKEILSVGRRVDVQILETFDDEEAAYQFEAQAIQDGTDLLNAMPGGSGAKSIPIAISQARAGIKKAKETLERMTPFDTWVARTNPSLDFIHIYKEVSDGLREVEMRCRKIIAQWDTERAALVSTECLEVGNGR